MKAFWRQSLLLFVSLRAGDLVTLAAALWFVPRFVSPQDLGAVIPVTSFATFLAMPVYGCALVTMKISADLTGRGLAGQRTALLRGVFASMALLLVLSLAGAAALLPRYLAEMRLSDASVGFFVVAASLLGCFAPVYTDALQALKRFGTLGAVEFCGALARVGVFALVMPLRPLAGYFAGQATQPLCRMLGGCTALWRELRRPPEPFWTPANVRLAVRLYMGTILYLGLSMAEGLVEQTVLRTGLDAADSAGYYMVSRFSDFLYLVTIPLLWVMFPHTADAAREGRPTRVFVLPASGVTLGVALLAALVYVPWGADLLAWLPNGDSYAACARFMPFLVLATGLTSCQVFYTNAELSAGRFGFLLWFVPLNLGAIAFLFAARGFFSSLDRLTGFMLALAVLRALCAGLALFAQKDKQ